MTAEILGPEGPEQFDVKASQAKIVAELQGAIPPIDVDREAGRGVATPASGEVDPRLVEAARLSREAVPGGLLHGETRDAAIRGIERVGGLAANAALDALRRDGVLPAEGGTSARVESPSGSASSETIDAASKLVDTAGKTAAEAPKLYDQDAEGAAPTWSSSTEAWAADAVAKAGARKGWFRRDRNNGSSSKTESPQPYDQDAAEGPSAHPTELVASTEPAATAPEATNDGPDRVARLGRRAARFLNPGAKHDTEAALSDADAALKARVEAELHGSVPVSGVRAPEAPTFETDPGYSKVSRFARRKVAGPPSPPREVDPNSAEAALGVPTPEPKVAPDRDPGLLQRGAERVREALTPPSLRPTRAEAPEAAPTRRRLGKRVTPEAAKGFVRDIDQAREMAYAQKLGQEQSQSLREVGNFEMARQREREGREAATAAGKDYNDRLHLRLANLDKLSRGGPGTSMHGEELRVIGQGYKRQIAGPDLAPVYERTRWARDGWHIRRVQELYYSSPTDPHIALIERFNRRTGEPISITTANTERDAFSRYKNGEIRAPKRALRQIAENSFKNSDKKEAHEAIFNRGAKAQYPGGIKSIGEWTFVGDRGLQLGAPETMHQLDEYRASRRRRASWWGRFFRL